MSSPFRFAVNSIRRTSPSASSTNFRVNIPGGFVGITKCSLLQVTLPNLIYKIRAGVNDSLDFNDGANKSITITPGAYSINTLCSTILTQLNITSSGFTAVTYSSTTFKVTITRGSNFNLLFATGANVSTSIRREIGFSAVDQTGTSTYTSQNAAALYNPLSLYISIPQICQDNINANNHRFTFVIPITVDTQGVMSFSYEQFYPQHVNVSIPDLNNLDVLVTFESGEVVDLNGGEFEMILELVRA